MLRKESGKLKQSKIIVKSSSNLEIYLAKEQIKLCIIFIYLHIMGASVFLLKLRTIYVQCEV